MFRFFITLLSLFFTQELLSMHRFVPVFFSRAAMRSHTTVGCPYGILGLTPDASMAAVERGYRNMAKQYHPDVPGGCRIKFEAVHKARDQIRNENRSSLLRFFRTGCSGVNDSFIALKESDLKYNWRPYFWATFGVGVLGAMVTSRQNSEEELERRKKAYQDYQDYWDSKK